MNTEIKKLDKTEILDFKSLIEIFKDVFENDELIASDEHLSNLLNNIDFLVFVVKLNGRLVGGLTIYVLQRYYASKPVAYIHDVGITPAHQGQGLGSALISEVCNYCKNNGFEDAYVEAEGDDIYAVNFYRKTKFSNEMSAIHFTYNFQNSKK